MLALILVALMGLYVGFVLPLLLSPSSGLSDGAQTIQRISGAFVAALYAGIFIPSVTGHFKRTLGLLAIAIVIQISTYVVVALTDSVFRGLERQAAVQKRFDAAAASYPVQVWCNGGFAYLRQDADGVEYDVMLHRPASQGGFATWVGRVEYLLTRDAYRWL